MKPLYVYTAKKLFLENKFKQAKGTRRWLGEIWSMK